MPNPSILAEDEEPTQHGITAVDAFALAQFALDEDAADTLPATLAARFEALAEEIRKDGIETRAAIHGLTDALRELTRRFDLVYTAARSAADHTLHTNQLVACLPCQKRGPPHHGCADTIPAPSLDA